MGDWRIREERPDDAGGLFRLLVAAFGHEAEARLVERLRADEAVALALVALEHDAPVGHVVFSRLQAPFPALALAPLAVLPDRQGHGLGSRLVEAGLARARAAGWRAVFVLGEPAYYGRFGFDAALAAGFETPYDWPFLQALALGGPLPARSGPIGYPAAFAALA